jgi:hypothetical protein
MNAYILPAQLRSHGKSVPGNSMDAVKGKDADGRKSLKSGGILTRLSRCFRGLSQLGSELHLPQPPLNICGYRYCLERLQTIGIEPERGHALCFLWIVKMTLFGRIQS